MTAVRRIEPSDWPAYRALRLRALQDAPDAFGSTFESERTLPDTFWRSRLEAAADDTDVPLFALDGQAPCGLVWCKRDAQQRSVAHLFQMWIAPASRGRGTGGVLLRAALDWAASVGVERVCLGVTVGDSPAARLYAAHGFVPVGAPQPLREGSPLMAQALERTLGTPPPQRTSRP
ncbi:GNAT family N-acetyltransferase [Hydrogenophaga sp. BPS33]|uniref:GNAT family N-acetyltransferase n=1 Tax=Hydrogenophaga sp. BPS33 TaxID=2651974 RepID=UPI00131F54BF|nr:GNAT family N-acetyltransferase [Hydrogenophaga sp. BPS33]QHE88296.1 GNAT family N-acetyltransferase [Hydrogenophaga sp. BPS33]